MASLKTLILNHQEIEKKITRIAWQIFEKNYEEKEIVLVGITDRGFLLAQKLVNTLQEISPIKINLAEISIDKSEPLENKQIQFSYPVSELKNKSVVLVDDVLNSGKTLIYGIKFLLDFPVKRLKTVVLVDRSHKRFPVQVDFVGLSLSTTLQEQINVEFKEGNDCVYLC
jgi:pyrimidine operon attenuation protein/uracil phosphoribosyltransferase